MNTILTGAPKTVVTVSDQTNLLAAAVGGIICVQGETLRGEPGKAVFVGSSGQFQRLFGGLHPDSPFPAYCLRMLNAGAKLYVARAAHYTTITDRASVAGTKATATVGTATFTAKYVGQGYNGATVVVQAPSSFKPGYVDLTITLPDSDQLQTVRDVPTAATATDLAELNRRLDHIAVTLASGSVSVGTAILSGGTQDVAAIVAADYAGSTLGANGWYAFSTVTEAYRIANIHKPQVEVDASLVAYVQARGDMRAHLGLPVGANAVGLEDYRMGTGAYSQSPIDTSDASFIGGAVTAQDDKGNDWVIPGIVDVLPLIAMKDATVGPWFSAAGPERGRVRSFNRGVPYNLLSPDNSAEFDRIYLRGINAVVEDPVYRTMFWGNRSGLLDNTKILSKENVADLVLYLKRTLKPLFRAQTFQPNDPNMWKSLYRSILPVLRDLEQRRAIQPGEGTNWFYQGDQEADDASQASFNSQDDIGAGKYRARLIFKPIAATEYLSLDLVATDAASLSFSVQQGVAN